MNEIMIDAPVAKKVKKELTIHGDTRIDNYYWMKLTDDQKNAKTPDEQTQEVLDFLNAENDFTSGKLKHTEGFQKKLFDEIVGRIKKDDTSVPYKDNGDIVIVKNIKKIKVTGKKADSKIYYHHSGYLGGLKKTPYKKLFARDPGEILRIAVFGMLPKNKLRSEQIKRLKIQ